MMINEFSKVTVYEAISSQNLGDSFSRYFFDEADAREHLQRDIDRTFRPERWTFAICGYEIDCQKLRNGVDFEEPLTAEELMEAYRDTYGDPCTGWVDSDTYEEI